MTRLAIAAALAALVVAAHASTASANGRYPLANQIAFHPRDPLTVVARTTFGLVVTHDGGATWRWMCESQLGFTPYEDPEIGVVGDGHILVSMYVGQRVGAPDACEFPFASPALQVVAADNVVDPSNADRAWLVTSAGAPAANQPWRSDDDGAHWTAVGASYADLLFTTIDIAPSDPARVYMAGTPKPSATGPRVAFVYRSTNAGAHFDAYPYVLADSETNVYITAVDPVDADRLFVRVSGNYVAGAFPDALRVSTDGGQSFHTTMTLDSMLGFARSDDGATVYVGGPKNGLYRSDDRGEHFLVVRNDVHPSCLAMRGDELWMCGDDSRDGFALGVSTDGGRHFEPRLRLADIAGPVECAEGTMGFCCGAPDEWCALESTLVPSANCTPPTTLTCLADGGLADGGAWDATYEPMGAVGDGGCCGVARVRAHEHGPLFVAAVIVLIAARRRVPPRSAKR